MSLQDDIARYADYLISEGDALRISLGLERDYYLVKLADLPEVQFADVGQRPSIARTPDGQLFNFEEATSDELHESVRFRLALALHLQSRESEAATLERRRDELVRECAPDVIGYDDAHGWLKAAIDKLIAAEAEVARLTKEAGK